VQTAMKEGLFDSIVINEVLLISPLL